MNGSPPAGGRAASLEVQLHPADIRRRVRYLFLGRRKITALSLGMLAYLLFLALAVGLAPLIWRDFAGGGEYQVLVGERMRQGQRMQELVGRLDQLADRGDDLGVQLARVRVVYGLQGSRAGSPAGAGEVPAVHAAPGSIYAGTVAQGWRLAGRLQGGLDAASAALRDLERFEREHGEEVATTPSACPLPAGSFVLTTAFARVRSPFTQELEFHPGLDLAAPRGTPVRAPAEGVVTHAGEHVAGAGARWRRLGRLVILAHGERYATVFGHLDRVEVRPGQRVRRGEVLGTVGTTGLSTHPHVHYEVRRLGLRPGSRSTSSLAINSERPLDPRLFMLDQRWPGEERLLAEAAAGPGPGDFDPLPAGRRRRR